jgi:hypothetical protein
VNVNCLKGLRCPNEDCRSYGPFRIEVTTIMTVCDDGTDDYGNVEWEDGSYIQCVMCSEEGSVHEFKDTYALIENLPFAAVQLRMMNGQVLDEDYDRYCYDWLKTPRLESHPDIEAAAKRHEERMSHGRD